MSKYPVYSPLDEMLEYPAVKSLRALRRFEFATPGDVIVALDAECEADAIRAALHVHFRANRIERIGDAKHGYRYRITDKGRTWLETKLAGIWRADASNRAA